jgi:hypothetical protein
MFRLFIASGCLAAMVALQAEPARAGNFVYTTLTAVPGQTLGSATGINDSNTVIGEYEADGGWGVFAWHDGTFTTPLPLNSQRYYTGQINNAGVAVGTNNNVSTKKGSATWPFTVDTTTSACNTTRSKGPSGQQVTASTMPVPLLAFIHYIRNLPRLPGRMACWCLLR